MSLERTESVSFNVENVENNEEIIEELDDDTMIENNAFEIIKNIEKLRAEQKEKMNKIKSYLMNRYQPDDIIRQCMQIGVSNTNTSDKSKHNHLIDINKCITRNEVVIISYKTGNVYTMEITPTITFQCIVDHILNETDEFIDDDDKQYVFRLDEKSVCDAYPTTEKFLQTSIEHNNKPKDN
jgi:hypothetical protein